MTSSLPSSAPRWFAALLGASLLPAFAAPAYRLTLLQDLPGGIVSSQAQALNASGQTGGQSVAADGHFGAVWNGAGAATSTGDLAGGHTSSMVYGLNDAGVAVGTANGSGGLRAMRWTASGGLQDLGELAGGIAASGAYAINNAGLIAGYSYDTVSGNNPVATLWTAQGAMRSIGDLPGGLYSSVARAINDAGTVVGYASSAAGTRAFSWSELAGMSELPAVAGSSLSHAYGVNAQGWAVGASVVASGGAGGSSWMASLWRDGVAINLGDLPGGATQSYAFGINGAGVVVGQANGARSVAAVWRPGQGVVDLNSLVTELPPGLLLTVASAINEGGQIAGYGTLDGNRIGYVLSPVPEPQSLALWLAGGLFVASRLRRR